MAAELVIADAPFKTYPGGVIVLRATDWMGSARGTLSSESDARACSGQAVRDAQKVTADASIGDSGSYSSASDTLTIDLSGLPIETTPVRYFVAVSFLIEGDWDPDEPLTTVGMSQYHLSKCAHIAYTFNAGSYNSSQALAYYPRLMPHYVIATSFINTLLTGTETMHLKAYSFTGTTIEFLIDQVYLVPLVTANATPWDNSDFLFVDGDHASFSVRESFEDWIDGADGGDDYGEFTLHPFDFDRQDAFGFVSGSGGDYQQKSSASGAEYYADVIGSEIIDGGEESDFYFIWNSQTLAEAASHGYGFHGPLLISTQTWMNDDFSRSIGDDNFAGTDGHFVTDGGWGTSDEGFFWTPVGQVGPSTVSGARVGKAIFADGSRGVMHVRRAADFTDIGEVSCHLRSSASGAHIAADNLSFTGKFRVDLIAEELVAGTPVSGDDHDVAALDCGFIESSGNPRPTYNIQFAYRTGEFKIEDHQNRSVNPGFFPLLDWTSIPWWTGAAEVAFRIEVYRYLLRVRVWDPTGAEPSTWDYEGFRNLNLPSSFPDYPYTGERLSDIWSAEAERLTPYVRIATGVIVGGGVEEMEASWDDLTVEHDCDPDGTDETGTDTNFSMERPKGVEVESIVVPAGAQHMVYWGSRDWTELFFGDPSFIDFAMKAWNETDAPAMHRAETLAWWFRSVHGGIVSMNWRSGDRSPMVKRMLVGGS